MEEVFSMTIITPFLAILSPWVGKLFTHNEFVLHLFLMIVLIIDPVSQPFLASVTVDTSVVQAGGNSEFPMIVTFIGIWVICTLGCLYICMEFGIWIACCLVWIAIASDNGLRAGLFLW